MMVRPNFITLYDNILMQLRSVTHRFIDVGSVRGTDLTPVFVDGYQLLMNLEIALSD